MRPRPTTRLLSALLSHLRPQQDIQPPGRFSRQVALHGEPDVDATRAERRAPAHADSSADVQGEAVDERIAGIGEHGRAPILVEIVFVLGTGYGQVLAADDVAVCAHFADG